MRDDTAGRTQGAILFLVLVLAACGPTASTTPRHLPSGKDIDVISMGSDGDAWDLEYCTHLPLSSYEPVACEAEAVWQGVATEAAASGASKAYIYATSCKRELKFAGWRPVILANTSTGFRLLRDRDGIWHKSGGWSRVVCQE